MAGMDAYDLSFRDPDSGVWWWSPDAPGAGGPAESDGPSGSVGGTVAGDHTGSGSRTLSAGEPHDGWIGSPGPAIGDAAWPRGPVTGLPMFHALTLRLPAEYRMRGAEFEAISLFQGEGQFADPSAPVTPDGASDDPFVRQLAGHRPHPTERGYVDEIDGRFAAVWLTRDEFEAGPADPPSDVRRPGEHGNDDEGPNAWDDVEPLRAVRLTVRPDPNAGRAPNERGDGGYRSPFLPDLTFAEWARDLGVRSHLGGTAFPDQAIPDGLTPAYLELLELPGMNLGGGSLQLDLSNDVFSWSCA